MRKDIPNFLNFVESYIIKYNNIIPLGVVPPDLLIGNIEKIEKVDAFMGALDHLVYVKALGYEEGNHGVGLGTDGSSLSNGILGALGYIAALISDVGAEGELFDKKEGVISELFQVLKALGLFTSKLNIGWAILIEWGNPKLVP